jgi:hypothetical protein
MGMPVASMDEDDGSVFWKNEIRFSGQVLSAQSKPKSLSVAFAPDEHLGLCVAALDAGHVIAARFLVVNVHRCRRELGL